MALTCFICNQMRTRNPTRHGDDATIGSITICLLCNRQFCESHKGNPDAVCEINHETYFRKHPTLYDIYPSLAARYEAVASRGPNEPA
ncbi:hypothetical protein M3J09_007506 [Ascochyta lentis]